MGLISEASSGVRGAQATVGAKAAKKVGKRTKLSRGTAGMALAGLIGGFAGLNRADPLDYAANAAFDTLHGNPDLDKEILGRDIKARDLLFPQASKWHPGSWNMHLAARAFESPKNFTANVARYNVDSGYAQEPYLGTTMPVRRSVIRTGVYASGDMVFGGYNMRHG